MPTKTLVSCADLLTAFEWVSAEFSTDNIAYVSRQTGEIHWVSEDLEPEDDLPTDLEDETLYAVVPHKNDFDLGRGLVMDFVAEALPDDYDTAAGYFSRSGAFRRFKDLLGHRGRLEAWYEYEAQATERALRGWCEAEGLKLKP